MSVRTVVCGAALLLAYWILAFGVPAAAPSTNTLSWRQETIIKTRAKVHACQDELGIRRSPVAQRVIRGGPAYRAWVLWRWRVRLDFCQEVHRQLSSDPVKAIMAVWGPELGPSAVRVARCESGSYWPHRANHATNGQYLGMFQMGNWARGRYGHSDTMLGQARAAYANFRDNGWSQWECASLTGVI